MDFQLKSDYQPTGDQPTAIESLVSGLTKGTSDQVLLGVTGSGKTFTIANVVQAVQKPTLVISPNKTLAAQLYQEFRDFFPDNAVSYFVSYYDFYQPEAYLPATDTYIEKETEVNEEIDKLRLQATANLLTRSDTIVVASVSCIYNIGSPLEYGKFILELTVDRSSAPQGDVQGHPLHKASRRDIQYRLSELQYERSDFSFHRGTYRVKGDTIDIFPSYEDFALRIDLLGDVIKGIKKIDSLTGQVLETLDRFVLYPAKHYMIESAKFNGAFAQIRKDLAIQVKNFEKTGKLLEAQRLKQRVTYDLEMINELGYVNGIENYSRYFDGRQSGDPPHSLLEYFPKDYLLVIDESHLGVPQIRGMYSGDMARKQVLVDFGFRLPAAIDNRPLKFTEFRSLVNQVIYTSATPGDYELEASAKAGGKVAEQLVRPTGILDPEVEVRPTEGQIKNLIGEIESRIKNQGRVLVTTLTKRTSEELTDYLNENFPHIKVEYLHSDIVTLERSAVLDKLRRGDVDVIVGINLLREGLDLPEVSLVAIIDADKEGFLRSKTSLIQTMGRAARNIDSKVIMYADNVTGSMKEAIAEVQRRRKKQEDWNKAHGITPKTIVKPIRGEVLQGYENKKESQKKVYSIMLDEELKALDLDQMLPEEKEDLKKVLTRRMKEAARILDFEGAVFYRDYLNKIL